MWDHPPAPYYARGHVCMMGDAAHASTPFQSAGAGQAIEDALVLETLLGRVQDRAQIPNAFASYDVVRRPRSQRVCATSREAGELLAMRLPGVGEDIKKIEQNLNTRLDWIWQEDLAAQTAKAVSLMNMNEHRIQSMELDKGIKY